jgi:3-deoxy-manno-octulosonate cytidylyltransferase (CMP-KDO synthetase)
MFATQPQPAIVACIPARAQSSRFPGTAKALADIAGKPMVMRVYERVSRSPSITGLFVVTDSEQIFQAVQAGRGNALMTAAEHRSGSDRIAEAARLLGLGSEDIVVNVQGDQPLFEPEMIDQVVRPLLEDPIVPMSTLVYPIVREEEINHPNAVKTVMDREGYAIYFSRATIPFFRDASPEPVYYKHHGVYAYRNDFLQTFCRLPQGFLERAERLEQLRALENGYRIKLVITQLDSIEVDTPQDLERVREAYRAMG